MLLLPKDDKFVANVQLDSVRQNTVCLEVICHSCLLLLIEFSCCCYCYCLLLLLSSFLLLLLLFYLLSKCSLVPNSFIRLLARDHKKFHCVYRRGEQAARDLYLLKSYWKYASFAGPSIAGELMHIESWKVGHGLSDSVTDGLRRFEREWRIKGGTRY